MARIDTTTIDGYDKMTAEEKLAALESYEYDDGASEIKRYKDAASKANSESAEWKRKHNALISDEEKKKQEDADKYAAMEKELGELRREKVIADHKAQFLAVGYDEALAAESAVAMADNDIKTIFANQKKFLDAHDKSILAKAMEKTPTPPAGSSTETRNYQKEIDDALLHGDRARAAALIRESQENK